MTPSGGPRRTVRVALIALLVLVVVAGGSWWAGSHVTSTRQAAADAAPPSPTEVTSTVEQRVVESTLVIRGTVTPSRTVDVSASGVVVPHGQARITKLSWKPGDSIKEGAVLVEVGTRPVFVMRGEVPTFRDLQPGDKGVDVAQLQKSLQRLGLMRAGRADGVFGTSTQAAVKRLYAKAGYDSATAPPAAAGPDDGAGDQGQATIPSDPGVMVPQGELVFLPTLPATVGARLAGVGDLTDKPVLRLVTGRLVLRCDVPPASAQLVRQGMAVAIDGLPSGSVTGTVATISAPSGNDGSADADGGGDGDAGSDGGEVSAVVTPAKPLSSEDADANVRVTITLASTDKKVLAVPVTALRTLAGGSLAVVVRDSDGTRRQVRVTSGLVGGGYAQVTAGGGSLRPGDTVVLSSEGAPAS